MKTRGGFVSNSSSSSFVFGFKERPTKGSILNKLGVAASSPLFSVAEEIAEALSSAEEGKGYLEDMLDDYEEGNEELKRLEALIDEHQYIYKIKMERGYDQSRAVINKMSVEGLESLGMKVLMDRRE